MSNEIVPATPAGPLEIPEYAQKYLAKKEGFAQDVGDITVSDIGLNFCKLVHGMSKEAKPGWSGPGSQPLPQGTIVLSRDHAILPVGSVIVPLLRRTRYIKWEGRPGDGQMIDQCESANDPKITRENGLSWGKDAKGDPVPPTWTKYVNFWVISKFNPDEPAILSFYRTSLNVAKKWTSELMRKTTNNGQAWKLPLFLFKYRLLEPIWATDGTNSWPQFNVAFEGMVDQRKLPQVERAYKTALALYHATGDQAQVYTDEPAEPVEAETADPGDSSGVALAAAIQQAEQERDATPPQSTPKAPQVAPAPTATVNVSPATVAAPAAPAAKPVPVAPAQTPDQPADTLWG